MPKVALRKGAAQGWMVAAAITMIRAKCPMKVAVMATTAQRSLLTAARCRMMKAAAKVAAAGWAAVEVAQAAPAITAGADR